MTPVYLYKLINGETAKFYTNVGSAQEFDGDTYLPIVISHTAPDITQDITQANVRITVPFDNPFVELHGPFPPPNDTLVTIFKFYLDVTDPEEHWTGVVRRVGHQGAQATLECATTLDLLQAEGNPENHGNLCNYFLGDGRCPVQMINWRVPVTATVISGNTVTVTGITEIDGWFQGGTFQAPDGDWRHITAHVGDVLTLNSPFTSTSLAVDDGADIYAGCDRAFSTCINKFGDETGDGAAFGGNPIQANVNPHQLGRVI